MADNTISPVVPNVSGGRNVSTGQKAVTQTAAQSGIDFKSYLGGRTAVQDNSTTFLKRRNSYTLNKNNTKEISIKTASKNSPTESEVKKITDDISSQIVEKVTDDLDISEDELNNAMQLLGLTAMDLLNPANLSALYCEVTGNASDPQALVLNADFTALFNDVSQVASENDAQLDLLSQLTASDDGEILDAGIVSSADTIVNKHKAAGSNKIVAIASSTGGPKALQSVIPFLPAELLAPVVLVQHMPAGFTKSMAERLNELSQVQVKEASNGEVLKNGVVYIAPGGTHIAIKKSGASHVISFNDMPPIGGLKPCANIMFDSLTSSNYDEVVCVVLTGMGADGTNGILSLGKSKPIYVIAQDEKSSVVYGMPRAIYEAGVVDEVVTLSDVAKAITKNVGVK